MHYFWRGDMPHFSPPLPFQPRAGARPRRARSGAPACAGLRQSPTPTAGAPSTSAGRRAGRPHMPGGGGHPTPAAGVPSTLAGQTPLQTGASQAQPARPQCGSQTGPPHRPLASRSKRGPPSPAALPHFHTTFDSAHNAILT